MEEYANGWLECHREVLEALTAMISVCEALHLSEEAVKTLKSAKDAISNMECPDK